MNRALFTPQEAEGGLIRLAHDDYRLQHIFSVLRLHPGDELEIGIINTSRGRARLESLSRTSALLRVISLDAPPDSLYPITLLLGHPRPIVLRRVLKDAATAGYARIVVTGSDLGERSYLKSSMWLPERAADLRGLLVQGAEQAGGCSIPDLQRAWSLRDALEHHLAAPLPPAAPAAYSEPTRIVLHPDFAAVPLRQLAGGLPPGQPLVVAIGPERGWSRQELEILAAADFTPAVFGSRILRTEMAVQWAASQLISLV